MTVRVARKRLLEEIAVLDGVEGVDVGADGPLHKLTILTTVESDLRDRTVALVGSAAVIENTIARDPTLKKCVSAS